MKMDVNDYACAPAFLTTAPVTSTSLQSSHLPSSSRRRPTSTPSISRPRCHRPSLPVCKAESKPSTSTTSDSSSSPLSQDSQPTSSTSMSTRTPVRRALISVSDKTSLEGLAAVLIENGVDLISTGGTYSALTEIGVPVSQVSDLTGYPELLDGRVKTLHPVIHAGLLAVRDNPDHVSTMEEHDIQPIDLLIVNLYPFEQTVAAGKSFSECIENIDVGGPTMIRAASKNFRHVTVVTDVSQYAYLIAELEEHNGCTTLDLRKRFAASAFSKLAAYDACVADKFSKELGEPFPQRILISASLKQNLRYGENPHQQAAFYTLNDARTMNTNQIAGISAHPCLSTAEQVQGKELSFNNIADTDAAFEVVSEFSPNGGPVCCIVKHANPSGVAMGVTAQDAYLRALACDPVSAFGGIVAMNVTVDKHVAEEISKLFTEVVIAPDATAEALAILSAKKNLRVLLTGRALETPDNEQGNNNNEASGIDESGNGERSRNADSNDVMESERSFKSVSGGVLIQTRDSGRRTIDEVQVVTKRQPSEQEMKDLLFAWKVCKHVKSNAIVYVKELATVGTGAGQMSRVDASRIAAWKAEEAASNAQEETRRTDGSVVASDAFFPFADGLVAAAEAGATAIIQPGGSKRDGEVIAAADERDLAMVFTGMRHFRH